MKRKIAIVLSLTLILCVAMIAGCAEGAPGADGDKPLVVGYSNFSSKFSPFFSETAYDQDVWVLTSVNLLDIDRQGAIVEKGKTGETRPYNGTDYTYEFLSDLTITENADGTIDYDFDLRDNVTFSDGEPLTADDVIFSMYVLADPTYDGSNTFFALPIAGMEEYRSGMSSLYSLILEAGEDNTDFSLWSEDEQKAFWADFGPAGEAFAQSIVDFCINNGYNAADDSVAACAANWGFELKDDATAADFWAAILEAYGNDVPTAVSTEAADVSFDELMPSFADYTKGVQTGESAASISGIQKTGDYSVRVTLTQVDAAAIYQLGIPVAPMHYYGDSSLYDYDADSFGFVKSDLSIVKSKTTQPMGAGPYKFVKFENGVVYFDANENYYKGAPKISHVQFLESSDKDKLNGVTTGTIDITDPSYSMDTVAAIKSANGNDDINGDVITTNTVDNLGYGYLGISAKAVNVGGDAASDASKNLRKAFATVFANFRDVTVDSYYGEAATVINYPISNTSWAAPQATDADYAIAFSKDVNGNDIYTSDMDADAREAAALEAALGYLEAAGYTVADGKVTAAPEGASLSYEVWIPADGAGDHPSFMMLNLAKDALAKIGIELVVKDLANSADLWTGLSADQVPMWCAAWGATPDPDMYQVYYSGTQGGEPGGSNYMYDISDPELDELILEARQSLDQSFRKQIYKSCLDIIVDWAVEIPVYQRQNAIIFSTERVNIDTVTPDITTYYPWLNEIQNLELN
ncbi:MAG: ABC transporter substrate-binding protein [Firmicutes bacterium]|nr:ABC transporter substrate-binding protein [Bacillota bacterium]